MRAEALRLARAIYPDFSVDIEALQLARRLRFKPWLLARFGYSQGPGYAAAGSAPEIQRPEQMLLQDYLSDPTVHERSQIPEEIVTTAEEVAMLTAAQVRLRSTLGKLEITVESCPSSNLLVGDFLRLEDHPLFRLLPLGHRTSDAPTVVTSVNTDDPLAFGTKLADEYAHLYYAALRLGASAQDALIWLETLRRNGWQSRFTLDASADVKCLQELLSA